MEPLKERIAIKALHPKPQEVDRELLARVEALGASLRPTPVVRLVHPAFEPLRQARLQQRRRQPQRLIEQIEGKRRANRHSSDISIVNVVADYDSYGANYAAVAVAGEQEALAQG